MSFLSDETSYALLPPWSVHGTRQLHIQTRSVAAGFGLPPPSSNDTNTALGQDGSDWSRDPATLTFDVRGHGACYWCGSPSSIRVPSLKFVCLAVRKIWRTMYVSVNGPVDLDLWPFDLETGVQVASKVGNFPSKSGHARPLGSRIIRYVRDGRTDKSNAYWRLLPFLYRQGTINAAYYFTLMYNSALCVW